MSREIFLKAGELNASFCQTDGGILLCGLSDEKSGISFFKGEVSLFKLTARSLKSGETVCLSSNEDWGEALTSIGKNSAVFTLSDNKKLSGVTVILTAVFGKNKIIWNTELQSDNNEFGLYKCDYPTLSYNKDQELTMFSPYGCGELHNGGETLDDYLPYPSFLASMQYFAVYHQNLRRGIYYGLHDSAPAYKSLFAKSSDETTAIWAEMPLSAINEGENSQCLAGNCVWELFDGDWYDAAIIYREWAEKHAGWMPEKKGEIRADLPEWMETLSHWWRVKLTEEGTEIDELLQAQEELGVTSALHLYYWHKIPFDNDYPHYFPPKDSFVPNVRKLQKAGVKVMPYINGRLWDTRDNGAEDGEFTKTAKPFCTKDREGNPFTESYGSKETDGTDVKLSPMCPSTALWQGKVAEIVKTLADDYGVDGVYIDQIAAAAPVLCEDSSHNHPAGGGGWWCESYRNLLDHVRRALPEKFLLTTEGSSEPFMKDIQGYLSWIWLRNDQVPAFQAIYSDYVISFGRNYSHFMGEDTFLSKDDGVSQRIIAAQSLTYGEQMGWMDPHIYLNMKHREFYAKCVRAREKLATFFVGRLLRSPRVEDERAPLSSDNIYYYDTDVLKHSPSFSELWEKNGKKLLLLVNAGEDEAELKVSCEIPNGVYRFDGECKTEISVQNGAFSVKLPPLSVNYCII